MLQAEKIFQLDAFCVIFKFLIYTKSSMKYSLCGRNISTSISHAL